MSDYISKIDAELRRKAADSDRDHSYFHPSAFGGCPVEVWMKAMGIEPDAPSSTPQSTRVFDEGHFLHLRYQLYTRDAGILCKDRVASASSEKMSLAGKLHDRVIITGDSGREYPYEVGEYLWKVSEPDPERPRVAGMEQPFLMRVDEMKVGDEFWLVEIPLMDQEYHFGGHADLICLDRGRQTVVDFKSKSEFTYARLWYNYDDRNSYQMGKMDDHLSMCHICGDTIEKAKDFVPHLEAKHPEWTHIDRTHRIQLHIYMWLLRIDQAILVHENKSRQGVHVQEIERDEELIERIKSNAKILWGKVTKEEMPERPYQRRTSFPCGWCDYSSKCWS